MHAIRASASDVPTCPAARDGAILSCTVHRAVAGDVLDTDGIASLGRSCCATRACSVAGHDDHQSERAKKQEVGTLQVP